jgi:hypothetical protein
MTQCFFGSSIKGQDVALLDLSTAATVTVSPQTLIVLKTVLSATSGYVKIASDDLQSYAAQLDLEACPVGGTLCAYWLNPFIRGTGYSTWLGRCDGIAAGCERRSACVARLSSPLQSLSAKCPAQYDA